MPMSRSSDLSRRQVLSTAALALASPLFRVRSAAAAQALVVEVENGRLQGLRDNDGVRFRGIPYGADTGGRNRFMAPRPAVNWTGVRAALDYGDPCPQGTGASPTPGASENCLVLNVYAPDINVTARRPVMVWVHGGGFRGGSGNVDGRALATVADAVVVTITHRIGAFGYSPLGYLDSEFADAGNVGQLDLLAALRWVKTNIHAFGGNPDNVTPFGVSGGGSKIQTLMIMPAANGLFQRAINQSGTTFYGLRPAAQWEPLMNAWLKELGVASTNLRRLQELPVSQLLAAHTRAVDTLQTDDYRPVIDGRHIPYGPLAPEAMAMKPSVPMIIQNCDSEATYYLRNDPRNAAVTTGQLRARIRAQYGLDDARAEAIMAGYRRDVQNQTPWDILAQFGSDVVFRGRQLLVAEALAATPGRHAPVYVSNVVWKPVVNGTTIWGTPHTADQSLLFDSDAAGSTSPGMAEASRNLMTAFGAFARAGNPNHPGMPEWKPYTSTDRATMTIGEECRVVSDYRGNGRRTSRDLLHQDAHELLDGPLFTYSE
jgi:para-nitrobenzyl esterase